VRLSLPTAGRTARRRNKRSTCALKQNNEPHVRLPDVTIKLSAARAKSRITKAPRLFVVRRIVAMVVVLGVAIRRLELRLCASSPIGAGLDALSRRTDDELAPVTIIAIIIGAVLVSAALGLFAPCVGWLR
jgi:hypothetical protein